MFGKCSPRATSSAQTCDLNRRPAIDRRGIEFSIFFLLQYFFLDALDFYDRVLEIMPQLPAISQLPNFEKWEVKATSSFCNQSSATENLYSEKEIRTLSENDVQINFKALPSNFYLTRNHL